MRLLLSRGDVLGETEDVAVAVLNLEFLHLVKSDFRLAGDLRAFCFEFLVEGVYVKASHVSVPGEIGKRGVVRPHVSLGAIAAEEELDAAALEHDEAGRFAPIAVERKTENVAIVFGRFGNVVDKEADGDRVEIAFLRSFVSHGKLLRWLP